MRGGYRSDYLKSAPVVGILRGFDWEQTRNVVRAAAAGGLRNLEITMNTAGAAEQISEACLMVNGQMNIGAGTVTSLEVLDKALKAGAGFIVTPTLCVPVVEQCVELGVPVFPGSMSPSEVLAGWELGATMVKVFPSEVLGPGYLRSLRAPFPGLGSCRRVGWIWAHSRIMAQRERVLSGLVVLYLTEAGWRRGIGRGSSRDVVSSSKRRPGLLNREKGLVSQEPIVPQFSAAVDNCL